MSTVRCKFYVYNKAETHNGKESLISVELMPVTSGSEENKAFYKYTPSGSIKFQTINKSAADALPLGAEVYVDLTVIVPE